MLLAYKLPCCRGQLQTRRPFSPTLAQPRLPPPPSRPHLRLRLQLCPPGRGGCRFLCQCALPLLQLGLAHRQLLQQTGLVLPAGAAGEGGGAFERTLAVGPRDRWACRAPASCRVGWTGDGQAHHLHFMRLCGRAFEWGGGWWAGQEVNVVAQAGGEG
jgi:hypothetical protein